MGQTCCSFNDRRGQLVLQIRDDVLLAWRSQLALGYIRVEPDCIPLLVSVLLLYIYSNV